MTAIKIVGTEVNHLSIELKDLISLFEDMSPLYWSILYFEGSGMLDGITMLDFEKEVNSSANGFHIDFTDLQNLAKNIHEITELVLIANRDKKRDKRYRDDYEMYLNCDFTMELVDSSYWLIHTRGEGDLALFKAIDGAFLVEEEK